MLSNASNQLIVSSKDIPRIAVDLNLRELMDDKSLTIFDILRRLINKLKGLGFLTSIIVAKDTYYS